MNNSDYESLIIPSFADLYRFRPSDSSPVIADWLKKELQLILANNTIIEGEHSDIKAQWADKSQPVLDRLTAVRAYFKDVSVRLEAAHAATFVQQRRLVHGPETFRDVLLYYCDKYNRGDWYDQNCWHLMNDATHRSGDTEKAAMNAAGYEGWITPLPLMTYPIIPNHPWPVGACDRGRAKAAKILEGYMYNYVSDVRRLCYEIKRLIKYGH